MTMNRRHALKQFLFVSAGIALIPACMHEKTRASVFLKNFSIDGDQEKMLAELSETIIPATGTPGAKDISAHLFVLKMMDDCAGKEDQQKFIKGLEAFSAMCKIETGEHFIHCTPEEKTACLQKTEAAGKNSDQHFFYSSVKQLTIQAYTSSKFYLTNINVYKLIPGPYRGCVPVKILS